MVVLYLLLMPHLMSQYGKVCQRQEPMLAWFWYFTKVKDLGTENNYLLSSAWTINNLACKSKLF